MPELGRFRTGPNGSGQRGIYTGDARELAEGIPDASIDLILTDPVYDRIEDYRWLTEMGARVLRKNCACLAFTNAKWLARVLSRVPSQQPVLTYSAEGGPASMNGKVIAKAHHLLWYGGGSVGRSFGYIPDNYRGCGFGDSGFRWQKNPKYIALVLRAFTRKDAVVFDPFAGGGTVPAVCKMTGRRYLAFEIEAEVAEGARRRVEVAPPPLFVMESEDRQAVMEMPA